MPYVASRKSFKYSKLQVRIVFSIHAGVEGINKSALCFPLEPKTSWDIRHKNQIDKREKYQLCHSKIELYNETEHMAIMSPPEPPFLTACLRMQPPTCRGKSFLGNLPQGVCERGWIFGVAEERERQTDRQTDREGVKLQSHTVFVGSPERPTLRHRSANTLLRGKVLKDKRRRKHNWAAEPGISMHIWQNVCQPIGELHSKHCLLKGYHLGLKCQALALLLRSVIGWGCPRRTWLSKSGGCQLTSLVATHWQVLSWRGIWVAPLQGCHTDLLCSFSYCLWLEKSLFHPWRGMDKGAERS